MTGSAYQAMDVLVSCDSLYRVGVWGRDCAAVLADSRLADCSKIIYIYIYSKNQLFGRSEKERFWERFWIGFWIGFGEVFREVLERLLERFWRDFWRGFGKVFGDYFDIIMIYFSYYSAYRVGKDSGRDLKVILIVFGWLFYSFSVIWEGILG